MTSLEQAVKEILCPAINGLEPTFGRIEQFGLVRRNSGKEGFYLADYKGNPAMFDDKAKNVVLFESEGGSFTNEPDSGRGLQRAKTYVNASVRALLQSESSEFTLSVANALSVLGSVEVQEFSLNENEVFAAVLDKQQYDESFFYSSITMTVRINIPLCKLC